MLLGILLSGPLPMNLDISLPRKIQPFPQQNWDYSLEIKNLCSYVGVSDHPFSADLMLLLHAAISAS